MCEEKATLQEWVLQKEPTINGYNKEESEAEKPHLDPYPDPDQAAGS